MSPASSPVTGAPTTWRNWVGNQQCQPRRILTPSTEAQLVDAVRSAAAAGETVRAVGAGHSFTPVIPTDGTLLDVSEYSGILDVDTARNRVRLRAGTRIRDLGEPLWQAGLALSNQGDIDAQTIAGAVSTGTHGSGIRYGSFSSMVTATRLVDGTGEVREINGSDPAALSAAQVSMGVLGVMLELEIAVKPAYYLAETVGYKSFGEVLEGWDDFIAGHRHFSFFWCPEDYSAALYLLPDAESAGADSCFVKIYDEVPEPTAGVGQRVGRAFEIYPHEFDPNFHEFEYFVPATHGREALLAVRDLMLTRHPDQRYPVEIRWVASDSALLSSNYQRNTTVISVAGKPGTDYWPYLHDVDRVLDDFDARPHWGKLHFFDRERIAKSFPAFDEFQARRRAMDPDGVFMNEHMRTMFAD